MSQNKPCGAAALTAEIQQILVEAQRQLKFAADRVIECLPIGNPKELQGRTQLLP